MNPVERANFSRDLASHLSDEFAFKCIPTAWKKPLAFGWQKFTRTYDGPLWNDSNGTGIITGAVSGITVILSRRRGWFWSLLSRLRSIYTAVSLIIIVGLAISLIV